MEKNELLKILDEYFRQDRKFIGTSRIPLICQDIHNIHEKLKEIVDGIEENNKRLMEKMDKEHANLVTKDQFWPVKTLVYSGTGVILLAVLGAMVALVINN